MNPSEIVINGRFLSQPVTGVQRFSRELTGAIDTLLNSGQSRLSSVRWACLAPPGNGLPPPSWECIKYQTIGRFSGNLWEQLDLPVAAGSRLLVNLGNIGPFLGRRQAIVFHDASVFAVPEAYTALFRLKHQVGLRLLGRTAELIFTVSEFSRQELVHYAGIPVERMEVLGEGCEHILKAPTDSKILERNELGKRPYLLVVSNLSRHKNLAVLVQALQRIPNPDFDVVFAGVTYAPVFQLGNSPLPNFVRQVGQVSDGELRALYESAAAFVFPSLYEGFGLPPLEAMACGCPVIVARSASLPEVCGDAALYFDPHNPDELAELINRLFQDAALQAEQRNKGLFHASKFTWAETARKFINRLESSLL